MKDVIHLPILNHIRTWYSANSCIFCLIWHPLQYLRSDHAGKEGWRIWSVTWKRTSNLPYDWKQLHAPSPVPGGTLDLVTQSSLCWIFRQGAIFTMKYANDHRLTGNCDHPCNWVILALTGLTCPALTHWPDQLSQSISKFLKDATLTLLYVGRLVSIWFVLASWRQCSLDSQD